MILEIISWVIISILGGIISIFLYEKCGIKNFLDKIKNNNSGPIFDSICNILSLAIIFCGFCGSFAFSFDVVTKIKNNDLQGAIISFILALLVTILFGINMNRNHD